MDIIIKNGQRKITVSVADQRATALVVKNLGALREHAAGKLAAAAEETLDALEDFMSLLATEDVEWAAVRNQKAPGSDAKDQDGKQAGGTPNAA